ncbi:MAG: hypothetical protein HWD63_02640 [Candidatus Parvibacillus calidus]|nr:MAG: hypothetical protein HWD63_02640 [Candidatus Parvibacillus calidus]
MKQSILLGMVILLYMVFSGGCAKDSVLCTDDGIFCGSMVNYVDEKALAAINSYLNRQEKNQADSVKLRLLKDWLECKSCIQEVRILCNSCIETYPAQSELSVGLTGSEPDNVLVLDILMSNPLKAIRIH